MDLQQLCARIAPPDEDAMAEARRRWDGVAKPLPTEPPVVLRANASMPGL